MSNGDQLRTGEQIKDPGNVIEVSDKMIPGITNRLLLEQHDDPITDEQIGEKVLSFSAECVNPIYTEPARGSMLVAAEQSHRRIYQNLCRNDASLYFVDTFLSPAVYQFEKRRMFLKILAGGGTSLAAMLAPSMPKSGRLAAAAALVYFMGPRMTRNVIAYRGAGRHFDFRAREGKAWKIANNVQDALHPDEHRFTSGLRNVLLPYKHRAAVRLQIAQTKGAGDEATSKNAVLAVGDGHFKMAGVLRTKTDEELLATIRMELQRLKKVDPDDEEMWQSISKIPEVWFSDTEDERAGSSFPAPHDLRGDHGRKFICTRIHEDPRLAALVQDIRSS